VNRQAQRASQAAFIQLVVMVALAVVFGAAGDKDAVKFLEALSATVVANACNLRPVPNLRATDLILPPAPAWRWRFPARLLPAR